MGPTMEFVSCIPLEFYLAAGVFNASDTLPGASESDGPIDQQIETLGEVFSSAEYSRGEPTVLTTDKEFRGSLEQHFKSINQRFKRALPSVLVVLRSASVQREVVYINAPLRKVLFETYRPNDRAVASLKKDSDLEVLTDSDENYINFYLGSAGSFNYGHWLSDDLPRLNALDLLHETYPGKKVRIWLTSYSEQINNVRIESMDEFLKGKTECEVKFLEGDISYQFNTLFYASPVSYHPHLKNPNAILFVSNAPFKTIIQTMPKRVFVKRQARHGRVLINSDEIEKYLVSQGFYIVDTEEMTFKLQVLVFSNADVIVGCMGAAMTNIIFAKPRTAAIFLAPEGWLEPYFWDLAHIVKVNYLICFGERDDRTVSPPSSSYRIKINMLSAALEILGLY